ncbi:hypothetical protein [Streptomyces sp. L2]|uniref:hypothetical protein n=1 Tax=Streptomyces sp. L2 TaxID=2162665 RepID=UPI0019D71684|nr:hypothetical protein [Streptomyces sp. L2]
MGIRMLHRRTPEAGTPARAVTASAPFAPASPVQAFAADASTARIPADLALTVRRAAKRLRRELAGRTAPARRAPDWRAWADLTRGYLALLIALVPRSRPRPTITVFVAAPLSGRPSAPARNPGSRPGPGPDARP